MEQNGSSLQPIHFEDGTVVYIESASGGSGSDEGRHVASGEDNLRQGFRSVAAVIRNLAHDIGDAVESATPSEAEVELSLGIKYEGGDLISFLVKGEASADFKITLKWSKDRKVSCKEPV